MELEKIRHSLAHLLAMAVLELMPEAKLAIGPTIEHGFYYDFLLPRTLIPEDLVILEKSLQRYIKANLVFERVQKPITEALAWADEYQAIFKRELILDLESLGEKEVSFYLTREPKQTKRSGRVVFVDLCKGPHVESTSEIPADAFKLTHISGAYWRGDENREQLQRVYGLAFANKGELKAYLHRQQEAEQRDHRKIGRELNLFAFSALVGSGLPLFTPQGTTVREELNKFIQSLQEPAGYQRVHIPHIAHAELYKRSGHWDKFKEDLFHVSGKTNQERVLKPMNCPHHTQIYAAQPRSYRDLPIRYSEVTTVYRDELPGELQGLSRVLALTQDDGHAFCTPDQVKSEVAAIYQIIEQFYQVFKMELRPRLSLHDPAKKQQYLGELAVWQRSEQLLTDILDEQRVNYEQAKGEAAFYGPKIDFMAKDALGREWQLATIQLDFNMPERFGLEYTDEQGRKQRPVMVHRAILGSVERFIAILIEHFAGRFPLWLAPEQVRVVSITNEQGEYAKAVQTKLREAGLRAGLAVTGDTIGKKIREAELLKVPVLLIVGQQELAAKTVTPRLRKDLVNDDRESKPMLLDKVISKLQSAIQTRSLELEL